MTEKSTFVDALREPGWWKPVAETQRKFPPELPAENK
jgi:hypothetical protein